MNTKPTALQLALLSDMVGGVKVYYIPYMGRFGDRYYFRADTGKKVTQAVDRLLKLKLVEEIRIRPLRIDGARPTEAGKALVASLQKKTDND